MWRSSLIQSSLSAFLMLMLMFMLDFSFDYEIPSFRQGSIFLRRSMSMRARTEHGTPNIERRTSNAEPTLAQRKRLRLPISHLPSSIFQTLARVVEWQTRTFEGRMPKGMRVQVPPRARLPRIERQCLNTVESPNHLATPVSFAATVPAFSPTVIRISFVIQRQSGSDHSDFVIPRPVSFFILPPRRGKFGSYCHKLRNHRFLRNYCSAEKNCANFIFFRGIWIVRRRLYLV